LKHIFVRALRARRIVATAKLRLLNNLTYLVTMYIHSVQYKWCSCSLWSLCEP